MSVSATNVSPSILKLEILGLTHKVSVESTCQNQNLPLIFGVIGAIMDAYMRGSPNATYRVSRLCKRERLIKINIKYDLLLSKEVSVAES